MQFIIVFIIEITSASFEGKKTNNELNREMTRAISPNNFKVVRGFLESMQNVSSLESNKNLPKKKHLIETRTYLSSGLIPLKCTGRITLKSCKSKPILKNKTFATCRLKESDNNHAIDATTIDKATYLGVGLVPIVSIKTNKDFNSNTSKTKELKPGRFSSSKDDNLNFNNLEEGFLKAEDNPNNMEYSENSIFAFKKLIDKFEQKAGEISIEMQNKRDGSENNNKTSIFEIRTAENILSGKTNEKRPLDSKEKAKELELNTFLSRSRNEFSSKHTKNDFSRAHPIENDLYKKGKVTNNRNKSYISEKSSNEIKSQYAIDEQKFMCQTESTVTRSQNRSKIQQKSIKCRFNNNRKTLDVSASKYKELSHVIDTEKVKSKSFNSHAVHQEEMIREDEINLNDLYNLEFDDFVKGIKDRNCSSFIINSEDFSIMFTVIKLENLVKVLLGAVDDILAKSSAKRAYRDNRIYKTHCTENEMSGFTLKNLVSFKSKIYKIVEFINTHRDELDVDDSILTDRLFTFDSSESSDKLQHNVIMHRSSDIDFLNKNSLRIPSSDSSDLSDEALAHATELNSINQIRQNLKKLKIDSNSMKNDLRFSKFSDEKLDKDIYNDSYTKSSEVRWKNKEKKNISIGSRDKLGNKSTSSDEILLVLISHITSVLESLHSLIDLNSI